MKRVLVKGEGSTTLKALAWRRIISALLIYLAIFPSFSFFLSLVEAKEDKNLQVSDNAEEVVISSRSGVTPTAVIVDSALKLCSSGVQLDDNECDYYNCIESYDFHEGDRIYYTIQYTTDYGKTIYRRIDYPDGSSSTDNDYYSTGGSWCLDGYKDLAYDKGNGNAYFTVTIEEDFTGNTKNSMKSFNYLPCTDDPDCPPDMSSIVCVGNSCCFCSDWNLDGCVEKDDCNNPQSSCCSAGTSCQDGSCQSCVDECNIFMQWHWYCDPFSSVCSPYSEEWYCDECDSDSCLDKCNNKCCAWGCDGYGYDYRCASAPECSFSAMECGNQCINQGYAMAQCAVGTCPSGWTNIGDYGCVGKQDCDRCCCSESTTTTPTTVPTTTTTIPNVGRCDYGSYPQIVCPDCNFGAEETQVLYTGDTMDTSSAISPIADKIEDIWYYDGVSWYVYTPSDAPDNLNQLTYNHCYVFDFNSVGTWTTHPECNDYCYGDILYHSGSWAGTQCVWSMKVCTYGCFNAKCVEQNAFPFKLYIENDVPGTVYKQPGDYVSLVVSSYKAQKINITFDPELIYVSGPISNGQVDAIAGDVQIKFQISEDASSKTYNIQGDNGELTDSTSFKVIMNPDIIIITDKDALTQRFSETKGPNSILQQAQIIANNKKGVLYDLSYYKNILGNRPWTNFSDYNEKPLSPTKKNNTYSNNLAEFIQKKCTDCGEVMIVGDDFVVPYYRVDYKIFTGWEIPIMHEWIANNPETKNLYSDASYIPRDVKTIAEIDSIFKHAEENQQKTRPFEWDGEQIIYVVPDDYNVTKLTSLNNTIKTYYPTIKEKNYRVYRSSQIACNEYGKLQENTLILIGDRTNNEAIKCVPWFDVRNEEKDKFNASLMLERNVWGGDTYSIIISGNTERGIKLLELLIASPELYNFALLQQTQVVYIYDFSSPPEYVSMDDYIYGYVFNDCEHVSSEEELGCYIIGAASYFVPYVGWVTVGRDVVNYCLTVDKDGTDWFICVSSAATLGWKALPNEVKGSIAKKVTDSRVFEAFTKVYSKTKEKLGSATNFLNKLGVTTKEKLYNFLQITDDGQVMEAVNEYTMILNEYDDGLREVLVLTEEGGDDILVKTVRNMDDVKNLGAGAERLMKSSDIGIKGLGQTLDMTDDELGRFIQSVGYAENKATISEEVLEKIQLHVLSDPDEIDDILGKSEMANIVVYTDDWQNIKDVHIYMKENANIEKLITGKFFYHEFIHIEFADKYGALNLLLDDAYKLYEKSYYYDFEEISTHLINFEFSGQSETVKNIIQSETYPIYSRIDADILVTKYLQKRQFNQIVELKAVSRILNLNYETWVDQVLQEKLNVEQINAINGLTNSFVNNAKTVFSNNQFVPKSDYSNIINDMGPLIDNLQSVMSGTFW